jgi:hypothetical protein
MEGVCVCVGEGMMVKGGRWGRVSISSKTAFDENIRFWRFDSDRVLCRFWIIIRITLNKTRRTFCPFVHNSTNVGKVIEPKDFFSDSVKHKNIQYNQKPHKIQTRLECSHFLSLFWLTQKPSICSALPLMVRILLDISLSADVEQFVEIFPYHKVLNDVWKRCNALTLNTKKDWPHWHTNGATATNTSSTHMVATNMSLQLIGRQTRHQHIVNSQDPSNTTPTHHQLTGSVKHVTNTSTHRIRRTRHQHIINSQDPSNTSPTRHQHNHDQLIARYTRRPTHDQLIGSQTRRDKMIPPLERRCVGSLDHPSIDRLLKK